MAGQSDGELNVSVGSSYDPKGINAAETAISSLVVKTSKASNQISANLAKSAQATVAAGGSIAKGSNQAAFALQNLGRVAQDAPFGFIGIQNNLNPLLESFQRLRVETGSNGAALKALGSSLIGPAGIGIALSVVSSAILLYQQYQQKANKATENAKKAADDYVKSLDAVTGANLKGAQNAQKEITDLKLLYSVYQNANLPLKQRQEAYSEIQKEYPKYFANIKFEGEASERTKKAYDELTQAIIATARARAAGDRISQNESRKLENEQKILDLQKDQLKNAKQFNDAIDRSNAVPLSGGATGGVATNLSDLTKAGIVQGKINENLQNRRNIVSDTNKLNEENARLLGYINTQVEKGAVIKGNVGDVAKETEKRVNANKLLAQSFTELNANLEGFNTKNVNFATGIKQGVTALDKLRGMFGYTNEELEFFISNYGIGLDQILRKTIAFNDQIGAALNNGVIAAFEGIGEAIGSSLANGTNLIDALGTSLLGVFGDLLVNLGKIAIQTGIGIKAIQTALKSLNPVVAIGAGVALIALGSLIKGKVSNLGGGNNNASSGGTGTRNVRAFASGGIVYGNTLAQVGEYPGASSNPEVIAPLNKLRDLIGDRGTSVNINAGVSLQGREFVLWFREQEALLGRTR